VWKRFISLCRGVLFIVAAYPMYRIGCWIGLWQPIVRPSAVSYRAKYYPTMTNEFWIECGIDFRRNVNPCRAWDAGGHLVASGNYRLDRENRAANVFELWPARVLPSYGYPEHTWIYLYNNRTLVPVDRAGEPLEKFEVR